MKVRLFKSEYSFLQKIGFVLGPLLAIFIFTYFKPSPGHPEIQYTAGIAVLMATWWITEAVPLAVTALLPVFLFPLLGVMDGKDVSTLYFNDVIFLFLGGFIVALAMEKWTLHKRIAIFALMVFGVKPKRILLGFMVTSSFLSMWISNTATAMMMVPIALSVIINLESTLGVEKMKRYSIGLLLGIAYSCSIGGIATLIGTPPNAAFLRIYAISFPDAPEITFASWFFFALPISITFLLIVWGVLSFLFGRINFKISHSLFQDQYRSLGKMTYEEKIVLFIFLTLALLWLTRASIDMGSIHIPGWSSLFKHPEYLNDGVVAIGISSLLFIIPAKDKGSIMEWENASKLPWGIVLLFGGGFALAGAFKVSGFSDWLGDSFYHMESYSPLVIIASVCGVLTFLTELTSNIATSQMILPILAALGSAIGKNPLLLMIPATLASSFAFMMPVATPPNAIIFGTKRIKIIDMAKVGLLINLLGIVILTIGILLLGSVLGINFNEMPDWAINP